MHYNAPFVSKKLTNFLMFINLLGPQLRDFNSRPYVLKWLSSGHSARLPTISHASDAPKEDDEQYHYKHMANLF